MTGVTLQADEYLVLSQAEFVKAANPGGISDPECFRFEANGIYNVSPGFISIPTNLRVKAPLSLIFEDQDQSKD